MAKNESLTAEDARHGDISNPRANSATSAVIYSAMKKVNLNEIKEEPWQSPGGKYAVSFKGISEALGREPASLDLSKRHPFDLEWNRVPAGKCNFPTTRTRPNGNCIW